MWDMCGPMDSGNDDVVHVYFLNRSWALFPVVLDNGDVCWLEPYYSGVIHRQAVHDLGIYPGHKDTKIHPSELMTMKMRGDLVYVYGKPA